MEFDQILLVIIGGVLGSIFLWWVVVVVVATSCCGSMSYTQIWKELERQHLPTPIFADKSHLECILQRVFIFFWVKYDFVFVPASICVRRCLREGRFGDVVCCRDNAAYTTQHSPCCKKICGHAKRNGPLGQQECCDEIFPYRCYTFAHESVSHKTNNYKSLNSIIFIM